MPSCVMICAGGGNLAEIFRFTVQSSSSQEGLKEREFFGSEPVLSKTIFSSPLRPIRLGLVVSTVVDEVLMFSRDQEQ